MLKSKKAVVDVNRNPLAFEELAVSLASLESYIDPQKKCLGMGDPIDEFERLYRRALREPPAYKEINELTGQSLSTSDRRASRAAWLLKKVRNIEVCAVHAQLWHRKGQKYSMLLLDQLGMILQLKKKLTDENLQTYGVKWGLIRVDFSLLDVVGVKDSEIYLVQALHDKRTLDSGVKFFRRDGQHVFRFRGTVFERVVLKGPALVTLCNAYDVITEAFPKVKVIPMVLVMHPELPDFELYRIRLDGGRRESIELGSELVVSNSIDYQAELEKDREWLWELSDRLDNDLFKGVPPCRGGRMLNILASVCKRQLECEQLLVCKRRKVCNMLKEDYNLDVPRDKLRHDLDDRLVGQGFMRKWGSEYSVTVKGIARYQYCLAKYTAVGTNEPQRVLDACFSQRRKIIRKYGCV